MLMRCLLLFVYMTVSLVSGSEPDMKVVFPLLDEMETVEQYAQRIDLPPTKMLDLGNDLKLEAVLVPAGKFIMGTPKHVNDAVPRMTSLICGIILLILVLRWWTTTRRPQFSLAFLMLMMFVVAVALWGYVRSCQVRKQWGNPNEYPAHEVTLTKPYYMGKFHVTMDQYLKIMGSTPCGYPYTKLAQGQKNTDLNIYQCQGTYPVWSVSWNDAKSFCEKLSMKTDETVRLPSEAEWEHACRAGSTTNFYSGDTQEDFERVGWSNLHLSETGYVAASNEFHAVGLKEPNRFGLYDMHGNVWQWCNDYYGLYSSESITDPKGHNTGAGHVLRGGSLTCTYTMCGSAYRSEGTENLVGFRVVIDAVRTVGVEK